MKVLRDEVVAKSIRALESSVPLLQRQPLDDGVQIDGLPCLAEGVTAWFR